MELAETLRAVLASGPVTPVAIGSGVMNDLVKYAAFQLDRPYLCVATAASMDGYTSAGSPLSDRGFKKTIQCRPARAVLGDLDVITSAPAAMTGWGYGDLAGKVPAGGDWIIADALGIEPIDDVAWPHGAGQPARLAGRPGRIAAGDPAAVEGLFAGLTLVGLAMELHGIVAPRLGRRPPDRASVGNGGSDAGRRAGQPRRLRGGRLRHRAGALRLAGRAI